MPDEFQFDVFLSHTVADKSVLGTLAERFWAEGLFSFGLRAHLEAG